MGGIALFEGWDIGLQQIPPLEEGHMVVNCKRHAGLYMLHFIHVLMRRSPIGEKEGGSKGVGALDLVIVGCLKAVYTESLDPGMKVIPWEIVNM